jgi:hypothetical protein
MYDDSIGQLLQLEKDFEQVIVENNAEAIGRFVADDWIIVDAEARIVEKNKFLAVVKSGALTYDSTSRECVSMEKQAWPQGVLPAPENTWE